MQARETVHTRSPKCGILFGKGRQERTYQKWNLKRLNESKNQPKHLFLKDNLLDCRLSRPSKYDLQDLIRSFWILLKLPSSKTFFKERFLGLFLIVQDFRFWYVPSCLLSSQTVSQSVLTLWRSGMNGCRLYRNFSCTFKTIYTFLSLYGRPRGKK